MLQITPIPAFDDNYIWLLSADGHDGCAVVDPGDEDPVLQHLAERGLRLDVILITHKHGDHVGGVAALKARWPDAVVYGPANEPIGLLDRRLRDGDELDLGRLGRYRVLEVPGHTEGHIAYHGQGVLFCGDTVFAGGCGRVFSGTFEQLSDSLARIAALSPATLLYCAHEYTLDNLGFARWVEPHNPDLDEREAADRAARARGEPTVPSTLALELATNPFLRQEQPTVIAAAEQWAGEALPGRHAVFRAIRSWKDREYD
jgi:hydroxyacylglutathione hydrolase